ncbi:hypothetical protein T12_8709 [Trichinella patagoniensis]|uniref:Uncharacterized protein n=1 Tax=Trichinella patagoniensis TaxID=990121 RepID=A0A0V0YXQ5_9BILA|nr:hypothetical protein T12_8709 [Trichinella patagoniensis]
MYIRRQTERHQLVAVLCDDVITNLRCKHLNSYALKFSIKHLSM